MEKYLRRCLDSLIIEEDGMKHLEVLVINDGSKDSSSQIAYEYHDKYPDTFKVIDKANGNYGSCINRGLNEMRGKYVKVLDADDWFDNKCFRNYLYFLRNVECDMVLTSFSRVDNDGKILQSMLWNIDGNKIIPIENLPLENIEMHGITYRSDILKSTKYRQTEGISYTDTEWSMIPIQYANNYIYYPEALYQYVIGRDGQTIQPDVFVRNYDQLLVVCRKVLSEYDFSKYNNKADRYIRYKFSIVLDFIYRTIILNDFQINLKPLICFDEYLKSKHIIIYNMLGNIKLSRKLRINYICIWRNNNFSTGNIILRAYIIYNKIKHYVIKLK